MCRSLSTTTRKLPTRITAPPGAALDTPCCPSLQMRDGKLRTDVALLMAEKFPEGTKDRVIAAIQKCSNADAGAYCTLLSNWVSASRSKGRDVARI